MNNSPRQTKAKEWILFHGMCKVDSFIPVPLSTAKYYREVKLVYEDKTLICKECNKEFVFTAGEQEFYAEKGFVNEPQRCKACRDARKAAAKVPRQMHDATCAQCGKSCQVPFEPKEDRPVYCSECFAKLSESKA